jgi:cytochrome c oxidase assembly factor CtaG/polyferredoxin
VNSTAAAVLASWTLDARFMALLLAAACVYVRGWRRGTRDASRLACFLGGLTVLFLALQSPLDAFASLYLSAHMTQHLLLLMIAPPLLLKSDPFAPLLRGLPRSFVKEGLGPFLIWPGLNRFLRWVATPPVTWLAFAVSTIGWHVPRLYELALGSPFWHGAQHASFFWTGILFWWPVLESHRRRAAWPRWTMLPYLLLADMLNTALSAFLIFSDRVLYPVYEAVQGSAVSALRDQAAAGAIMWVPGSIVYIVPAIAVAVRLFSDPGAAERRMPRYRAAAVGSTINRAPHPSRLPVLRRLLQIAMLLVAIAVMSDGFFGSRVSALNLAGVLPWVYWRAFSVLALLVAGNVFCMVCPFTLVRDIGRRFLPAVRRWPRRLRTKWLPAALLLLYLWVYEAYSLWDSPLLTAWIVAGYFAAALAIDGVFRGAGFCKYVCPIGQFHFLGSLVSPAEVRIRSAGVCQNCRTHDCIRGNSRARGCELYLFQPKKAGNMDCTFCLDCVTACPHENVAILPAPPARTLIADPYRSSFGRLSKRSDVAALAGVFVFGAFVNAAGMISPVMMWEHRWHARLGPGSMPAIVAAFIFTGVVIVPAIGLLLCATLNRPQRLPVGFGDLIRRFTLTLVPLGFTMWAAHVAYHLATARSTIPDWLTPAQLILLDAGLLLTLYVIRRVALHYVARGRTAAALAAPWMALAGVLYGIGIWILFQPMQMRGAMQ